MLVYGPLEIGRAAEVLLGCYLRDERISGEWARLRAYHEAALRHVSDLGIRLWRPIPPPQRDALLRAASYERQHGAPLWAEVATEVGDDLVMRFRTVREACQRELAEKQQLRDLYQALWDFAVQWDLDYTWIIQGLIVRALQQKGVLPEEIPDEAADLLLPDLGPSLEMPSVPWWVAGRPKQEQDVRLRKARAAWVQELRGRGFVGPFRELERHMMWLFCYDARKMTAPQICADLNLNPRERTVREIQQAINSWHKRLGKLTTRRGRPRSRA